MIETVRSSTYTRLASAIRTRFSKTDAPRSIRSADPGPVAIDRMNGAAGVKNAPRGPIAIAEIEFD